jgi:hypothetical protein
MQFGGKFNRLDSVRSLAHNSNVDGALQNRLDTLAKQSVIITHQYADLPARFFARPMPKCDIPLFFLLS